MKLISKRMDLIPPSGTVSMLEKAKKMERLGRKVLHMEVGEPDFDTPEHVKKAAYQAIKKGFTHYTSSKGILELREAIAQDLEMRGIIADPNDEILVTPGGKHALYCACLATLDPGDEVLILSPSWPTHFVCVQAAEAKPIEVVTKEGYGFDEEEMKKRITNKTKMIIINSPNNPTGGVLIREEVEAIANLAEEYDLTVLSDEIYDRIVYDGFKPVSMASIEGMNMKTITLNGFSKAYAMTGWRLGYAVANKEIIDAMQRIQQNTTTCPASFVQIAGLEALRGPQDIVEKMTSEYDKRRRRIVEELDDIPKVMCQMPKGAFYVFPDFSALGKPSKNIVNELLEKEGVSSTAGSVFGSLGEGHIRLSYATSLTIILEAMEKIRHYIEGLPK